MSLACDSIYHLLPQGATDQFCSTCTLLDHTRAVAFDIGFAGFYIHSQRILKIFFNIVGM